MININRKDYYWYDKLNAYGGELQERTKKRLTQISELGMDECGVAQFGIKGVMSGLYIEMVWRHSDEEWDGYMEWVNSLLQEKEYEKQEEQHFDFMLMLFDVSHTKNSMWYQDRKEKFIGWLRLQKDKGDKALRLLHDLTPQGSEFYNDPEYCAKWIRESRQQESETLKKIIVLKNKGIKALEEALPELLKTIYHEIDINCLSETNHVTMDTVRNVLVKHGANEPDLY